jgi:hypothetical protein
VWSGKTLRRLLVVLPAVAVVAVLPVATFRRPAPRPVLKMLGLRAPGVQRAPMSFRMMGVSWPTGDVHPAAVRVRTSTDGRRWSGWTTLEVAPDEAPDPGTHEAQRMGTDPLWVGRARFVDVHWTGSLSPRAKVALIDPGPDPAAPPAAAAEASPGTPPIITRAQWGADESIRKCCPEYAEPLQMAFIHHTDSGNSYAPSDSKAIVRSIYVYHVKSNGWNDIGYNFLVDRYGQIFEGRYGGMDRALVGAHTLGFNAHSTGIAVIGTFSSAAPPPVAMTALKQITAWRLDRSYVDPGGSTTMTSSGNPNYAAGTRVTLRTISGHRDVYPTDCPGAAFYAQLPALRSQVVNDGDPKIYYPSLSAGVITPNGDGVADSVRLNMRFSSTTAWSVGVVDSNGAAWSSWTGTGTSASLVWNGKNGTAVAPHDFYRFIVNGHNGNGALRTAVFGVAVWQFPDGTLLRASSSGFVGVLDGGKLRHFLNWRAMQSRYNVAEMINAPDDVLSVYPHGADIGFRDGSVVRVTPNMWIISDGERRAVTDATLSTLGYNSASIIDTDSGGIQPTPEGSPVLPTDTYPDGTALQSSNGNEALVVSSTYRPFITANVRQSYQIRDVDLAGPADSDVAAAQSSPPVGFRDGTLVQVTGNPAVYVIADGMRRWITSAYRFNTMAYKWSNIRQITADELALNPAGPPL